MKIIIIIGAVIIAALGGYLIRLAIDEFIEDQVIITKHNPLSMIPDTVKYTFGMAIFLFIMAITMLMISLKGPY